LLKKYNPLPSPPRRGGSLATRKKRVLEGKKEKIFYNNYSKVSAPSPLERVGERKK